MTKRYTQTLIPIVKKATKNARQHFGSTMQTSYKSSEAENVVTEFDREIETILKEKLREAYPDIGFVGEEFGGEEGSERFWLVDPIDGTGYFVRGLPFCTTLVALIENGVVTASIVYDIATGDVYSAERGRGAFRNETEKLSVSNRTLQEAYLNVESKAETDEDKEKVLWLEKNYTVQKIICCGYEMSMLASGKLDGSFFIHPYGEPYDYAAGALLVEEAGGIVRNFGSETYDYRNMHFFATNQAIYKELKALGTLDIV